MAQLEQGVDEDDESDTLFKDDDVGIWLALSLPKTKLYLTHQLVVLTIIKISR